MKCHYFSLPCDVCLNKESVTEASTAVTRLINISVCEESAVRPSEDLWWFQVTCVWGWGRHVWTRQCFHWVPKRGTLNLLSLFMIWRHKQWKQFFYTLHLWLFGSFRWDHVTFTGQLWGTLVRAGIKKQKVCGLFSDDERWLAFRPPVQTRPVSVKFQHQTRASPW